MLLGLDARSGSGRCWKRTPLLSPAVFARTTRTRGIAAWKDGKPKATWEYELADNPCQLTYSGQPTFIPCDVERLFCQARHGLR